jgi:hypothetical protein
MVKVEKLARNVYALSGSVASATVSFGDGNFVNDATVLDSKNPASGKKRHVSWGDKDGALIEMHKICCENPTKWRLIETRCDFLMGKGLLIEEKAVVDDKLVTKYVDDTETNAIEAELKRLRYRKTLAAAAMQIEFSGRVFLKLILGTDLKVERLDMVDVFQCRPVICGPGETEIKQYVTNPNFGQKNEKRSDDKFFPAFDYREPLKYAVSIIDIKRAVPGMFYNTFAVWWGTKQWAINANKIAKFHASGLDNGYNLKYHLEFPDDYFDAEGLETEDEKEDLKLDVLTQLSETLSGVDNVNKIAVTFNKVDSTGKIIAGVKITPLPNLMTDDAYSNILMMASEESASAHGLTPSLAGISKSGMGTSGKEIESAAKYTEEVLTYSTRVLLNEPFEILRDIYGWSEKKVPVFQKFELYTFDSTPAGSESNLTTKTPSNKTKK